TPDLYRAYTSRPVPLVCTPRERIILRDGDGRLAPYQNSRDTDRWRKQVLAFNESAQWRLNAGYSWCEAKIELPHYRKDAPVTCAACGRRVARKARQQRYCSDRCRDYEKGQRRVRKSFLSTDTRASPNPPFFT